MGAKKILIVDDDEAIRLLLKMTLEDQGYETIEASGAIEALNIIEKSFLEHHPIDLVTLDIRMPGMDGLEALPRILGIDEDIRVILYTAYPEYKESFMGWAAHAYVTKSADLGELLDKVRELLD